MARRPQKIIGRSGLDELRQHERNQHFGGLLRDGSGDGEGRGGPGGGTGQRRKGDALAGDLQHGFDFVVGEGQRADGRDAQSQHFGGGAKHFGHAHGVLHFGGNLHAGSLQRLGGEGHSMAVHCQRHQLARHVRGGEEGRDSVAVGQGIQQAGGVAHILQDGKTMLARSGVVDVARAAQVVEVERAIAQGFDRPTASAHGDLRRAFGEAILDQFGWQADTIILDSRACIGQHLARAGVSQNHADFGQNARGGVVHGFDFRVADDF